MQNFNINDMKDLFGSTPIGELPGVQAHGNNKINWWYLGIAFGAGMAFQYMLFRIAQKNNPALIAIKKLQDTLEKKKEMKEEMPTPGAIKKESVVEKATEFPKTEDSIQESFGKFDSEIVEEVETED